MRHSQKIISLAPGRTCLFGDHQDYLQLPIIACAINRHIKLEAIPNGKNYFTINKPDIESSETIFINVNTDKINPNEHFLSALRVLARYGCVPDIGYDITIQGNIPVNAGISSSSAVVVSWIRFLLEAFGADVPVTPNLVAKIAFDAEVTEHGAPGGKMDQYSISLGNTIYLNTDEASDYELLKTPLKGLIVGESGIPKDTTGLLAQKKQSQLNAISEIKDNQPNFNVSSTKSNLVETYLDKVSSENRPYLKAAISNYHITREALSIFKTTNINHSLIGKLMYRHHCILRDILGISLPLIDDMIATAMRAGAWGAKIVGSGGGGSIVALAPQERIVEVTDAIKAIGGKDAYGVDIDTGARIIHS